MNPRHSHIVESFDMAPHHLSGDLRLLRNCNIGRAGRDDEHMAERNLFWVANGYDPCRLVVHCSAIEPPNDFRHLLRRAGGQERTMMTQEGSCDRSNLRIGLSLTKNYFREPLSQGSMVIKRGESQIFIRQSAELLQRRLDRERPAPNFGEQPPEPRWIHDAPFSALACRSIKSVTARRQDFPSNKTELISCTIGISTRCRRASPSAALAVRTPSATACIPLRMASSRSPCPNRTPTI